MGFREGHPVGMPVYFMIQGTVVGKELIVPQ